jgi:hypothetical protein
LIAVLVPGRYWEYDCKQEKGRIDFSSPSLKVSRKENSRFFHSLPNARIRTLNIHKSAAELTTVEETPDTGLAEWFINA